MRGVANRRLTGVAGGVGLEPTRGGPKPPGLPLAEPPLAPSEGIEPVQQPESNSGLVIHTRGLSTRPGIRTLTGPGLNRTPLPIGLVALEYPPRDSNSQSRRHVGLNHACIPFPPDGLACARRDSNSHAAVRLALRPQRSVSTVPPRALEPPTRDSNPYETVLETVRLNLRCRE
jgi:hypothetical protein